MSQKKYLFKQFLIDPKSKEFSASRLALLVLVATDVIWALTAVLGINKTPASLANPISYMLGMCTGAVAGIYTASTYGVGRFGWGMGRSPMPPMGDK